MGGTLVARCYGIESLPYLFSPSERTFPLNHTDAQTHRHADIQTHRHADTQTHRHTDTQTHRHTDTDTQTHTDR